MIAKLISGLVAAPKPAPKLRVHRLYVPGIPEPWDRPRPRKGAAFMRKKFYSPHKDGEWYQRVEQMALLIKPRPAFTGAVRVDMTFVFPRPASVDASVIYVTTTPDDDNLKKAVQDALRGAWFKDDNVVSYGAQRKVYEVRGVAGPGVYITASELVNDARELMLPIESFLPKVKQDGTFVDGWWG